MRPVHSELGSGLNPVEWRVLGKFGLHCCWGTRDSRFLGALDTSMTKCIVIVLYYLVT